MTDESEYRTPFGYPYMLFLKDAENPNPVFFLATSEEEAKNQSKKASMVDVLDLITFYGHQETHKFLKKIGKQWVCRIGKIYYKGNSNNAMAINKKRY